MLKGEHGEVVGFDVEDGEEEVGLYWCVEG